MLIPSLAAALAPPLAVQVAPAASEIVTTESGLRFQVLAPGTGRRPVPGDAVQVTYEGRLADGTVFETTPGPVGLPVAGLIPGFTEALQLMNVGGRYRFWIPPALAYGAEGAEGVIPPDAELEFTMTLLAVGAPARP